jgi:hypothetical protein
VSRGFPASSPTCTAAPNLKLHMQHSLVCPWSAACYNSNPFFNNNQRQSTMYLSVITPGCNFPRELIIRPRAATTATASCTARNLLNSRKSANKKSTRFKRHFSNRKKTLQKNYCRLISQSNIRNGRSIDLPAENPPASERASEGTSDASERSCSPRARESERACARSGGPRTTVRHKTFRAVIQLWKIPPTVVVSFLVPSFGLPKHCLLKEKNYLPSPQKILAWMH